MKHMLPVSEKNWKKKQSKLLHPHSSVEKSKNNPYFQGRGQEKKSYRPISTLYPFGKILEKIVISQLEIDLNENNILSPQQFAFRRGISKKKCSLKFVKPSLSCF